MRKSMCVKALSLLLALVTVLGVVAVVPVGAVKASAATAGSSDLADILNAQSYADYIKAYANELKNQKDKNSSAAVNMPSITVFDASKPMYSDFETDLAVKDYSAADGAFYPDANTVYRMDSLDGSAAIFTPDNGSLTWTFEVPQLNLRGDGKDDIGYLYMIVIEYYPIVIPGKENVATVERSLSLATKVRNTKCSKCKALLPAFSSTDLTVTCSDPECATVNPTYSMADKAAIPFAEARALSFSKNWVYSYTTEDGTLMKEYFTNGSKLFDDETIDFYYEQDKGDNDLRYTAVQDPKWRTYYAQDVDGFHRGNFYFFFEAAPKFNPSTGAENEPTKHTITISGSRENLAIKSITLVPAQQDATPSYDEYLAKYAGRVDEAANGGKITTLGAEFPTNVSDTSVYPANDRSSAITEPSSPKSQLMNTIGNASYNTVGQWASYKFTVNKSGWYTMTMRYRQNLLDGLFVSRAIKLSGGDYGLPDGTPTVPFHEAYNTRFNYSKDWKVNSLGAVIDSQMTEFRFYFEAGVEYTVYYEVSLGDLADIIKRVQNSLGVINDCYLNIIKLTGASPDQYRDYGFKEIMPEVIRAMYDQSVELYTIAAEFEQLAGTKGSQVATLEQIAFLLDRMSGKESEVAKNLSNLKSNIGTLGTWLNTVKQQGLLVDYVDIQPLGGEKPRENANVFETVWFELRAFFVSFFVDYNSMGVKEGLEVEEGAGIDVWLAYGRDQSLIWRNLIDSEFTPKENIPVQLKLVTGGTLLPSVLSGRGPDVYIGLGSGDVINYAIRGAIQDVNGEEIGDYEGYVDTYGYDVDLTEKNETDFGRTYYVTEEYAKAHPSKVYLDDDKHPVVEKDGVKKYEVRDDSIVFNYANTIPISLLGKTYGVPETTNFSMMFYRMDVLADPDVNVSVPRTWDDLLAATTSFQANNMQVGLSYLSSMTTFVYQKGGSQWMYEDEDDYLDPTRFDPKYAGAEIGLGTDIALEAFRFCARLYTDYSFPVAFDAANRFRTGEMPIIITDYCAMYNQLTVFATEIRGLWSFAPLPGFEQYDENGKLIYVDKNGDGLYDKNVDESVINNCAVASLTATVMLYKEDDAQYADAWKYMKWQAAADAQASYGNQMVAIVGPAAKYATANNQALKSLSWTSTELASLLKQFDNLAAVPSFPGSYIISRYVEFAFLAAVNEGADPVDQLSNYVTIINKELTRKRKEFMEFDNGNGLGTMDDFKDGTTPPWEIPPASK